VITRAEGPYLEGQVGCMADRMEIQPSLVPSTEPLSLAGGTSRPLWNLVIKHRIYLAPYNLVPDLLLSTLLFLYTMTSLAKPFCSTPAKSFATNISQISSTQKNRERAERRARLGMESWSAEQAESLQGQMKNSAGKQTSSSAS
jgi:hypothetical protein